MSVILEFRKNDDGDYDSNDHKRHDDYDDDALLHSDQPAKDDDRVGGEGNVVWLRCNVKYFQSSLSLKGDIYFEKKWKLIWAAGTFHLMTWEQLKKNSLNVKEKLKRGKIIWKWKVDQPVVW